MPPASIFYFSVWNSNMSLKACLELYSDLPFVKFAFHTLLFFFILSNPLFCFMSFSYNSSWYFNHLWLISPKASPQWRLFLQNFPPYSVCLFHLWLSSPKSSKWEAFFTIFQGPYYRCVFNYPSRVLSTWPSPRTANSSLDKPRRVGPSCIIW